LHGQTILLATTKGLYYLNIDLKLVEIVISIDLTQSRFDNVLVSPCGRIVVAINLNKLVLIDAKDFQELTSIETRCEKVHVTDGYCFYWDSVKNYWCVFDFTGNEVIKTIMETPINDLYTNYT
jgi:hypothetical protein